MKKKLSLKEIFQGSIIRLGIKEIFKTAGFENKIAKINIRLINRIPYAPLKKQNSTIAIITPPALNQLRVMKEKLCRQALDNLFKKQIVFLILSGSLSLPVFLKNHTANSNIPVAASKYDEHYLISLLKALVREKIQNTISLHGVLLEANENGILITGTSGIGKTTAVLKSVVKDYYWVADDIAVIKKNKRGELIAGGNKKIKNYIHTEATGIISVGNLLDPGRIKVNTKLAAIVEIKGFGKKTEITKVRKGVLGTKLNSLHINIPATSYFDEKLLKKAIRMILKGD